MSFKKGQVVIYEGLHPKAKGLKILVLEDTTSSDVFKGVIVYASSEYEHKIGHESSSWVEERFVPFSCVGHDWVSVLDCQYPFRACKLCKEIETLEQEAV